VGVGVFLIHCGTVPGWILLEPRFVLTSASLFDRFFNLGTVLGSEFSNEVIVDAMILLRTLLVRMVKDVLLAAASISEDDDFL